MRSFVQIRLGFKFQLVDSEKQESTKSAAELKITTRKQISLYIGDKSYIYRQIITRIDTKVVRERDLGLGSIYILGQTNASQSTNQGARKQQEGEVMKVRRLRSWQDSTEEGKESWNCGISSSTSSNFSTVVNLQLSWGCD